MGFGGDGKRAGEAAENLTCRSIPDLSIEAYDQRINEQCQFHCCFMHANSNLYHSSGNSITTRCFSVVS